jgi:anti-anti-sigma factor
MVTQEKTMDIDVTTTAQAVIVAVRGRLDTTSAPVFEQRLADVITQGATYIVMQCNELAYINSAGLRSVLLGGKKLQAQQGRLVFVGLQGIVKEIFDMAGFSTLFQTFASEDAALA